MYVYAQAVNMEVTAVTYNRSFAGERVLYIAPAAESCLVVLTIHCQYSVQGAG